MLIPNLSAMILHRGSAAVPLCSCPQAELAGPGHSPVTHPTSHMDNLPGLTSLNILTENWDQLAQTCPLLLLYVRVSKCHNKSLVSLEILSPQ